MSMLSMCCRSDALPSPSPLPFTHETLATSGFSAASVVSAPVSVSSFPSCVSA
ncbi:hypothetical protein OG194_00855 [Streptomyces sp. NBC_01288]|uniref:hypothetical protein n=1 Tax=Streptomyces sp. NBC_01288 TaxID=2903814 RepID=UPI002E1589A6|nr:hypothetical protein OG194_00855 [Streptomyces sp. NBC_01288]